MVYYIIDKSPKKAKGVLGVDMGGRDVEWGIITIIIATFFLFLGLDMFRVDVVDSFNQGAAIFLAFILIAAGVYLVSKK